MARRLPLASTWRPEALRLGMQPWVTRLDAMTPEAAPVERGPLSARELEVAELVSRASPINRSPTRCRLATNRPEPCAAHPHQTRDEQPNPDRRVVQRPVAVPPVRQGAPSAGAMAAAALATPDPPSGASIACSADSTTPTTPSIEAALTWPMWAMRNARPARCCNPTPNVTPHICRDRSPTTRWRRWTRFGSWSRSRRGARGGRRTAIARPGRTMSTAARTAEASTLCRRHRPPALPLRSSAGPHGNRRCGSREPYAEPQVLRAFLEAERPVPVPSAHVGGPVRLERPRSRRHEAESRRRHQTLLRRGKRYIDTHTSISNCSHPIEAMQSTISSAG